MESIFTFATTREAIHGERVLLEAGEPVRVMPLPDSIAAGCGICLRLPASGHNRAHALLEQNAVRVQSMHLCLDNTYPAILPPVFSRAFGIGPGEVVALIGCGGKTALANRLAMENRFVPVLFSTTTHIAAPPCVDYHAGDTAIVRPGIHLACEPDGGKLKSIAPERLARLAPPAGATILEADGSRGLPLKGWAEHEPVIPASTTLTVGVCTVQPIGMAFSEALVHRPALFRKITGIRQGDSIALRHIAAMLGAMFHKAVGRRAVFINQVESPEQEEHARLLAGMATGMRVVAGSVRDSRALVLAEGGGQWNQT